jgi:hypothetical protein
VRERNRETAEEQKSDKVMNGQTEKERKQIEIRESFKKWKRMAKRR